MAELDSGTPAQNVAPVGSTPLANTGEAPTPTPDPTPAPAEPHISFPDQEKFNERLARNHASQLKKDFGVESPEALKVQLAEFEKLKGEQEERTRAAMTKDEKYQADISQLQSDKAALQEERDQVRFESHINGICAELGVTNVDYAMFQLTRAADKLPEGEQLDAKEHLSELLEGTNSRAALGLPPVATQVSTGATTTPGQTPPTPDPANPGNNPVDATTMNREEFQAHLASKGVGLTGG